MRRIFPHLGLAMLLCGLIGACAPQTSVVKLYEDPEQASRTYNRLLIVDIAADSAQQQMFESEIVARLKQDGVDAIPAYTMLDTSNGVTQEDINTAGEQVRADAILVSHIASLDTQVDIIEGRQVLESTCRRGDPVDYFLYDHEIIAEPDSVKIAHTVAVISHLYDGSSHKRVWSIQSTCFEKASLSAALIEEATAIARQLRIDELIE
ncbi:MAG: hypothetical protein K0U72_16970 [Gammaproteobacteria bacterium]|nr:hypothetical protein [Gammaproteobacteria bacterium]